MSRPAKRSRPRKSGGANCGPAQKKSATFKNNIKGMRFRRYYSQQELADMIGVSRVSIANWEAGTKNPTDDNKVALCKALNCSMHDLFNMEV